MKFLPTPNVVLDSTVRLRSDLPPRGSIQSNARSGLTLIEIMIALTMTLIVLGAMMTAFQFASQKMQAGRAVMELANRARSAESLLRADLAGLTVEPRPYAQTASPPGYFEYLEGPTRDATNTLSANNNYLGDIDDVLAMTVRSSGRMFRGRWNGGIIESPQAEVVWFTTWNDLDVNPATIKFEESVSVRRRVLLIAPAGVPRLLLDEATDVNVNLFFSNNDISARVVSGDTATTYDVIANNLNDLALRKNRFCHQQDPFNPTNDPNIHNFPNVLRRDFLVNRLSPSGDDIVLSDVAGFDLRVYSPNININTSAATGVDVIAEPSDPGYVNYASSVGSPNGAFVDLAGDPTDPNGWFAGNASVKSQCSYTQALSLLPFAGIENVYDTWAPYYESNSVNEDSDALLDEGTNGLDDDNLNGVDDTAERETLPPYAHPIRGLQVSIRLIEKGTKQVHQTTIVHSFVPE